MISQRASQISLSLLLLSGPLLAFSVRGFAAMMALAGIAAAVSLMPRSKEILAELRPEKLKPFALPLAALAYILVSSNWSISDRGGDTAVRLILVIGFAAACIKMFAGLPEAQKPNWARRLAVSLSAGIGLSLLIGPYNVYCRSSFSFSKTSLNCCVQVNSALSIMPVFLFLLAAAFSRTHFRLACGALAVAFVVTAVSESQTSLLSMLLGVTAFGLAKLSVKLCRNLVFGALLVSTLAAPHIFVSSQENGWVESYAPAVVKNKGAGEIRQWIYFVYGKEALERPLFGHGLNGTKFLPLTNWPTIRQNNSSRREQKAHQPRKTGRYSCGSCPIICFANRLRVRLCRRPAHSGSRLGLAAEHGDAYFKRVRSIRVGGNRRIAWHADVRFYPVAQLADGCICMRRGNRNHIALCGRQKNIVPKTA